MRYYETLYIVNPNLENEASGYLPWARSELN